VIRITPSLRGPDFVDDDQGALCRLDDHWQSFVNGGLIAGACAAL
jgi:hypothetical protein